MYLTIFLKSKKQEKLILTVTQASFFKKNSLLVIVKRFQNHVLSTMGILTWLKLICSSRHVSYRSWTQSCITWVTQEEEFTLHEKERI